MKYSKDKYELLHKYPNDLKIGDYIVGDNNSYSEKIIKIDFIDDCAEDKICKEVDSHNRRPWYHLQVKCCSNNEKETCNIGIVSGYVMDILPDEITTILRFTLNDLFKKL